MNTILIYFAIKYKGDWDKIYKALKIKEKVSIQNLELIEKEIKESKYKITTILDEDYPEQFKECYKPPFVIWTKGEYNIINKKFIAITGVKFSKNIDKEIIDNISLVNKNNFFVSILNNQFEKKFLNYVIKNYLIIVSFGLKAFLEINHYKNALILSEFPPNIQKNQFNHDTTYRLSACFAEKIIFLSSDQNQEIIKVINNFLNLGKKIYTVQNQKFQQENKILAKNSIKIKAFKSIFFN